MSEQLISKKELLEKYGISYGALYRWKRKGLIPEDWFIKKSTVTGQETFFPRELMIERMELIKSKKDEIPLDTISEQLNVKSQSEKTLIINTVFGERAFRLDDIKSIVLDNGEGDRIDISARLKKLLENKEI